MSTTLPSSASKANCDASTDDPKQALLTDLAGQVDKFNTLLGALGALAQYQIGDGLGTETQGAGTPDKLRTRLPVVAKAGTYTALTTDRAKLIDCTGTFTLAFTAAATLGDGWYCAVRNSGSGTITLDPDASEQIDSAATVALGPGDSCHVTCNGTAFYTVGRTVSVAGGAVSDVITQNTNVTLSISTHSAKLVQTTSGNPVYTFPTAVGNQGKTLVLRNGTSSDTGLRLVPNGAESLGGATGSTIYIPAYTVIGFVSDGSNWIVFFYSGKRLFRFEGSGTSNTVSTFHVPPGFYSGLGTVVGGGGGGTDGIGSGATGGTSSIGGLLQATGGAGVTGGSTAVTTGGTPNGQRGGNGNNVDAGGNTPFGKGGIGGLQTHLAASGFGAGGKSSDYSGTDQSTGASGGWRIDEAISLTPGVAITITSAGGGAKGSGGAAGGEAGRPGLVIIRI